MKDDYTVNTVHIHIPDDLSRKYLKELKSTSTSKITHNVGKEVISDEFSFQEFFDKIYDAILIVTKDGVIIEANYRSTVMFSLTKKELTNKRLNQLIPSMDGLLLKQLQDNSKLGLMSLIEISCQNSIGQNFPTEIAVNQLECSSRDNYILSIRNITRRVKDAAEIENAYKNLNYKNQELYDRRRELLSLYEELWGREKELLHERDLLHTLMSNMPEHIFFKDAKSRYLRINDSLATFMGLTDPKEIEGKSDSDFFPQELADSMKEDEQKIMESAEALYNKEQSFINKQNEQVWLTTSKVPVYDENGDSLGIVGISRDDTAVVEARQLTQSAKREAEEANKIKGDFLANVTHELKTPLNPILGLSAMIQRDPNSYLDSPEELVKHAGAINSAAKNLQNIIDDLLTMVKKDHKYQDDTQQDFLLSELLMGVYNLHSYDAQKQCVNFNVDDFEPLTIRSDYKRLHHILSNFVGNALKFTSENGNVSIKVTENNEALLITVHDTGIGIKEENLSRVFERFTQVEQSMTRSFSGTGLGLAIVEEMSSLIGVTPFVTSIYGEGSQFGISIPKSYIVR